MLSERKISKDVILMQERLVEFDLNVSPEDVTRLQQRLFLSKNDFTLLESLHGGRGKLATVHKATLRDEEVICKIIKNDRITNFLVEAFVETICKLR